MKFFCDYWSPLSSNIAILNVFCFGFVLMKEKEFVGEDKWKCELNWICVSKKKEKKSQNDMLFNRNTRCLLYVEIILNDKWNEEISYFSWKNPKKITTKTKPTIIHKMYVLIEIELSIFLF